MKYEQLTLLIPAIIAIIIGLGVLEIINLNFLISQKNLITFTGLVAIIAGLWLSISTLSIAIKE